MVKYRKTALVDAEQFLPPHQIPTGCYQEGTMGDVAHGHGEWFLKTLEGKHPLRYADYICKGVQGERWNVEVSIFEATYEVAAVEQPTPSREEVEGRFWLIVHEPGMVPQRKGSWPQDWLAQIMREFIAACPTAYLTVLTVGTDGTPDVQHGPEALQMADGRSMSVGRKHNVRARAAHFAEHARHPGWTKRGNDWLNDGAPIPLTPVEHARGEEEIERAFKAGWDKCWCRDPDAPSARDGGKQAAWEQFAALSTKGAGNHG